MLYQPAANAPVLWGSYVYPLALAAERHAASLGMRVLEPGHVLVFLSPSTYMTPVRVTFQVALNLWSMTSVGNFDFFLLSVTIMGALWQLSGALNQLSVREIRLISPKYLSFLH